MSKHRRRPAKGNAKNKKSTPSAPDTQSRKTKESPATPARVQALRPPPIRKTSRSELRKHLDERLRSLYQRAMVIEQELRHLDDNRFYRVCIFGSARIKPDTEAYNQVFTLARYLAWNSIDILTGGGPGLMEAGNKGAKLGQEEKKTKSLSFGISIELDFEPEPNLHLDVKRHHHKFSSRLDDFMRLSNAVVVTPGGIGTLLELFFTWQLIQVRHIEMRPIVLMDKKFWTGVIDWMRDMPLGRQLVSAKDFDCISIVDSPEEVLEIISAHHKAFLKEHGRGVPEPSAGGAKARA